MKIIFANGSEIRYQKAIETEEYWCGASRRTLSFEILPEDADLTALNALCSEDNCAALTLVGDGENNIGIYEGYVLKLKVASEPVLVNAGQGLWGEKIFLKLGRRTYIEQRLKELGI